METRELPSLKLIPFVLRHRFVTPFWSSTFYAHLIGGVILLGGSGVWFALIKSQRSIEETTTALLGYFASLVGAALLEFSDDEQPFIRTFGIFSAIVLIYLALLLVALLGAVGQLVVAIFGSILGLAYWWVANGLNRRFTHDINPNSAIGGDPSVGFPQSTEGGWQR